MASLPLVSSRLIPPDRQVVRAALRELQVELRQLYSSRVPEVLVYGSYARGEETPASDIDILLLFSQAVQPGEEIQRLGLILSRLNLRYQVLISILPARKADYQRNSSPFWQNLRQEGISIDQI